MSWFDPPALVQKPLPPNAVVFPPEVKKGRVFSWVLLMAFLVGSLMGALGFGFAWVLGLVIPLPSIIRHSVTVLFAFIGAIWGALTSWTLIVESVRAAQRNPSS